MMMDFENKRELQILYRVAVEDTDEHGLAEAERELRRLAASEGVDPAEWRDAWHPRYVSITAESIEDLARDFHEHGYKVDFDDGPFITIYRKRRGATSASERSSRKR